MSLGGFAGFGSLCDNYAWILLTVSDDPVLKCFIFSKKCALFDWFFLLKSKYIDTGIDRHALKHNTGLFLVGTMKLKYTLSGGRVDAWPTLFFGEHSAVCVPECDWFHYSRDDISPRSVAMPVVVNKHSMAFILLVSSPLVCSGCTFPQRASFSVSHSLSEVVKIHQFLSLIIYILARTWRGFPPKWEIRPTQGNKKCLLARTKAVQCEDMKVVSHFGDLAPRNLEKFG